VGVVYVVVGWIMMQVGEVTFEALGLPPWSLTLLIVLVLLGFPISLVLAWAYEITPQGIRKDPVGQAGEGVEHGVEIGREGEPDVLEVVARVDDHGEILLAQTVKPVGELCATELSAECDDRSHCLAPSVPRCGSLTF